MGLHLPIYLRFAIMAVLTTLTSAFGEDTAATFTTTNSQSANNNNVEAIGFTCILSSSRLKTSSDSAFVPITGTSSVNLVSVSANLRHTPDGTDSVGLALTDGRGTVISLATNTIAITGNATWNFAEDTTVGTDSSLYFVFYKASNANIQVGYTFQTLDDFESN